MRKRRLNKGCNVRDEDLVRHRLCLPSSVLGHVMWILAVFRTDVLQDLFCVSLRNQSAFHPELRILNREFEHKMA